MEYIYLHGFASSPKSNKAQYLGNCFKNRGLQLNILDLNQGDFGNLTLSRQIQQTIDAFSNTDRSVTLIGSSFGGLTAAWVANKSDRVKQLILLAPAFGFPQSWYSRLELSQIERWRESGLLSVYHYGEGKQIPLKYKFLQDADLYPVSQLKRDLPTLIINGLNDEVVPIQVSRDYARSHSQANLIELNSDHGLNDSQEAIWYKIQESLIV